MAPSYIINKTTYSTEGVWSCTTCLIRGGGGGGRLWFDTSAMEWCKENVISQSEWSLFTRVAQ